MTRRSGPEAVEARARRVFGARAAHYVTSETHADPVVLARVVELAGRAAGTALDVGAGTGHTAFALARAGFAVVALDLTPEMLAEARQVARREGLDGVRFEVGDVHALPFPDAAFEVVTCRRAAHHFSDIGAALAEMVRVLKPGGRLVIDDRSVPEDDFVDATMQRLDTLHDPSHVRQYRPSEWLRMLERAGLGVYAIEPYTQHRPLTSLTLGVPEADVAEIERTIAGLSPAQRAAMAVDERDGAVHTDHWYVTLLAIKPDG
jgi:SAM-dependent methyltransferase